MLLKFLASSRFWQLANVFCPSGGSESRLAVSKILCAAPGNPSQNVLLIKDPNLDLEFLPVGIKFKRANVKPQFVMLLCFADEMPDITEVDIGNGEFVQMVYEKVYCSGVDRATAVPFSVESLCLKEASDAFQSV